MADVRLTRSAIDIADAGSADIRLSRVAIDIAESLRTSPTGGGAVDDTVVNPAVSDIGTDVKRVFLRLTIGTGSPYTELAYAETTLRDDPSWYGGKKQARLISIGAFTRELSESFRGTEVRVVLADDDTRPLRTLAASGGLSDAVGEIFVVDDTTRYAGGEPYRLFNGIVHKHDALPGFQYELVLRDVLSEKIATLDDSPRMPPGVLNEPEFPGIRGAFENRAIPLVLGHCDDSAELPSSTSAVAGPQGVIPPLILGVINFQTAFGGIDQDVIACIWGQCAQAANGIWQVWFNTPDNPYVRVQVPLSSFGVDVWTPGMPGWSDVGVANDYIDYPASGPESRRYTPFFVNANGAYAQPFLDGQILVAGNLYGVAENPDGTGGYLSDAPKIWQWLLVNFLYSEYRTGSFAAIPTFANGHSIVNVASVATATARLQAFDTSSPGQYPVGFLLGHDGKQQTLRHVLEELCRGVLMEQGIDRHGRLMVDVEDVDAAATVSLSDLFDIEGDSFTTWIDRDGYRNYVEYVFGFRYVPPTAPIKTPPGGEALPKQPVSPYSDWTSGLQVVKSDDAIAANRGTHKKLFIENRVVRSEAVATSVATRALHRAIGASPGYEGPRMWRLTTSWQGLYKNGVEIELGTVVALDHLEGIGASGWTNRRGRVLKITVDPLNARVTLEGRILYSAGAGES